MRAIHCLLCSVLLCTAAVADDTGRDNGRMVNLVETLAGQSLGSVVQIHSAGEIVALGTVVSADGYILTKHSELNGDPLRVRLPDNRILPARVAAARRGNDLALLQVESDQPLKPVDFSTHVPPIASFLFSPDRMGRPIGIGVVGTLPRPVADQGKLGVVLRDDEQGRARVDEVEPNSGAGRAGIQRGDRIVAINGRHEDNRHGVLQTLQSMFPGETVTLTVLRTVDGQAPETLELDARITEYALMMESDSDMRVNGPRNARLSGFDLVIQHDTVLDPAECGGPVLDSSGRVVGLNIARAGRVVSYAIPSSLIKTELASMLAEAAANR